MLPHPSQTKHDPAILIFTPQVIQSGASDFKPVRDSKTSMELLAGEALRHPGAATEAVAIAEEAVQAVVVAEIAHAAGQGQAVGQVEGKLAEHRLVTVLALLCSQPDGVGPAVDFDVAR